MRHPAQHTMLARLRTRRDTFPHDREFLQAFITGTRPALWETLSAINADDEEQTIAAAEWLAYLVAGTDVDNDGALPPWYDMKPSEYRRAKAAAADRLRAAARELGMLIPGLDRVSALATIWPDGELPERIGDALREDALSFPAHAVNELSDFYDKHPEACPTITGPQGIIEAICAEVESFEPRRYSKPKSGPAWPRHFVCQLFERIENDRMFSAISMAGKHRLTDACLHFYAGWIGRPGDSADWTESRVADAVSR